MRRVLSTIVLALGLGFVAVPAYADGCCEPVSDGMATQDPIAYSSLTSRPCETRKSVNCYWDVIGRTGEWGQSYFVLRVGNRVCIKYWDAGYDRKHGHCSRVRGHQKGATVALTRSLR